MGRYRLSDALLPPGLLSAARIALGALFPRALAEGAGCAAMVVMAAGATDVLDGVCARRLGMATPAGAVLDAVADKIFVMGALLGLTAHGRLDRYEAILLGVREAVELPLGTWFVATGRAAASSDDDHPRSNKAGKLATTLQFATLAAALVGAPRRVRRALAWSAAVVGAMAAATYVAREAHRSRAVQAWTALGLVISGRRVPPRPEKASSFGVPTSLVRDSAAPFARPE